MALWKNYEVNEEKQYFVALIQSSDGERSYELCEAGVRPVSEDVVFTTEIVPYELLFWRRIQEISETIKLTNGKRFYVEAHNVWFTEEEVLALDDDSDDVPWVNGIPPTLPPM